MDVGMRLQGLSPSVQDAKKANVGAEMLGIGGYFEQSGRAGFKQESEQ